MSALENDLIIMIRLCGMPTPVRELVFAPPRKWRFDLCWPDLMVAVEIEGGTWVRGRHSRGVGMSKDCEKYNEAALLGYKVLRFTVDMVRSGLAIRTIKRALDK